VQILFARFKDGKVDLKDSYKSEWIGTPTGGPTTQIAGHGEIVVGTCGRKGLNMDALGLVVRK
jgi:hypothetical protein